MVLGLILVLALGILLGAQNLMADFVNYLESFSSYTLFLLLFLIGAELGSSGGLKDKFKNLDPIILLLPVFSIFGSLAGGAFTGWLTKIGLWQGAAIGGGMGWYSLSGIIIGQKLNPQLGALAFLTNIFREVYTFLLIPLLFKLKLGPAALTVGGATTMDTTLPIISRYGGFEMSLIALWHGIFCSISVPFVVSLMITPLV